MSKPESKTEKSEKAIAKLTELIAPTVGQTDNKGNIEVASGSVFDENLPEGVTVDSVKALNNYVADFNAASLHAAKGPAIQALVDNKDLERVKVKVDLGCFGDATSAVSRESTNRDPRDKTKEIVTKGAVRTRVELGSGIFGKRYDAAKAAIKTLAEEKL